MGKALIGAHKDDIVDVETPAGIMQVQCTSIRRNIQKYKEKGVKRLAQQTQEQDINHLLKVRREKLAELQQNGRDPFQITVRSDTYSLEVKGLYEAHETELLKDRQEPNVEDG